MNVFGLFSGIGGLELGFHQAQFETAGLCERDTFCRTVLAKRFPGVLLESDIFDLQVLPKVDVILVGFPCQPFSQAGPTSGISASKSLLAKMFQLVETSSPPTHIVLENVPNIIYLDNGEALAYITKKLERLGYHWAYRIVDTLEVGIPQRRRRWILIASLDDRVPSRLLDWDAPARIRTEATAHGFYWTEGTRGLGWAHDAIPPLKAGSGLNIPSPPAIWDRRTRKIATPDIRDAELLQGFSANWTACVGEDLKAQRQRWKMVGNAVSVPVARYLANILRSGCRTNVPLGTRFLKSGPWPPAAYGHRGERRAITLPGPIETPTTPILDFLAYETVPLSFRATRGFRTRLHESSLKYPSQFIADLRFHERLMHRSM